MGLTVPPPEKKQSDAEACWVNVDNMQEPQLLRGWTVGEQLG